MRYTIYDFQRQLLQPAVAAFAHAEQVAKSENYIFSGTALGRLQSAWFESAHRLVKSYPKRGYAYPDVKIGKRKFPVTKSIVARKPFSNLLHFRREGLPNNAPKVLFVAAISGHHATLSKETYEEFLPDHNVYVTDWQDARNVPVRDGKFGFEEYVSYLIEFLQVTGANTHVFAICQATVAALVATAVMAEDKSAIRPRSLTMLAGPIDIRVNSNALLKRSQLMKKFNGMLKAAAIHPVPARFAGAGRKVYPGVMQVSGFMSMNKRMHLAKHIQFFKDVYKGNDVSAQKHRDFYDEYFAILDMDADFYLETLERIFMDQQLPKGTMRYQGRLVDCGHIVDVPILTLEGAEDDMVSVGQTQAALDLCHALPDEMKQTHVQAGVGHYGVFKGDLFRREVAPLAKQFIKSSSRRKRV